jgi:signal peptidase I
MGVFLAREEAENYAAKREPFHRCGRIILGVNEGGGRYPKISASPILGRMKYQSILLLTSLFISTVSSVLADDIGQVQSASIGRETRRTIDRAPTSGINRGIANIAASRLSSLVDGTKVFTVAPTGSMRPLFDDNSVLLVEPSPFASLQIGDIVVYQHSTLNKLIVHRILEKRSGGFWAKGDHNSRMDDELVTAANYKGRVYGILYASRSTPKPAPDLLRSSGGTLTASAQ